MKKTIVLVPLDPVHDVALKMLNRYLSEHGHKVILLPPDLKPEEAVQVCMKEKPDFIMVSRTLGYNAAEILGRFIDLLEASNLRDTCKVVVGGKAVTPELAAELGYDAGFGERTEWEQVLAYVEGREIQEAENLIRKRKRDLTSGYSYEVRDSQIRKMLDTIADQAIEWTSSRTTPGILRAEIRERLINGENVKSEYVNLCNGPIEQFYRQNIIPRHVRKISPAEKQNLEHLIREMRVSGKILQLSRTKPAVFVQYGTGCPFMDIVHIKISESWGADGVLHFDPSWGARCEGLLEGLLAHEEDGSLITLENLVIIKSALEDYTLWCVRAHRGLNTPETVLLAAKTGADLTKINMVYGSLNGGTDPARLTVDGIHALKLAAKYSLPFDIPTNEELGGVPAEKAFAGMITVAYMGIKLGAKPILKPLFCHSPDAMINGYMEDNFVDYNVGKILALRKIIDAPIWPGEPIGFMTHSEDRVQSAMTTALHAALAHSLDLEAITIASTDEAYARGAITVPARIDSLRAIGDAFRFFGKASIEPTNQAQTYAEMIYARTIETLQKVVDRADFVASLYEGDFGSKEDGANPGRAGRDTVIE